MYIFEVHSHVQYIIQGTSNVGRHLWSFNLPLRQGHNGSEKLFYSIRSHEEEKITFEEETTLITEHSTPPLQSRKRLDEEIKATEEGPSCINISSSFGEEINTDSNWNTGGSYSTSWNDDDVKEQYMEGHVIKSRNKIETDSTAK